MLSFNDYYEGYAGYYDVITIIQKEINLNFELRKHANDLLESNHIDFMWKFYDYAKKMEFDALKRNKMPQYLLDFTNEMSNSRRAMSMLLKNNHLIELSFLFEGESDNWKIMLGKILKAYYKNRFRNIKEDYFSLFKKAIKTEEIIIDRINSGNLKKVFIEKQDEIITFSHYNYLDLSCFFNNYSATNNLENNLAAYNINGEFFYFIGNCSFPIKEYSQSIKNTH